MSEDEWDADEVDLPADKFNKFAHQQQGLSASLSPTSASSPKPTETDTSEPLHVDVRIAADKFNKLNVGETYNRPSSASTSKSSASFPRAASTPQTDASSPNRSVDSPTWSPRFNVASPSAENASPSSAYDSPTSTGTSPSSKTSMRQVQHAEGKAFTEELDPESLAFFNDLTQKTFSKQAIEFMNAYWEEIGDQAEFIFTIAWDTLKYADMHFKGVTLLHLYEEGNDLDFNVGLYFYEKLCKRVLDDAEGKKWREDPKYSVSMPTMMTALTRKKELREKVDCNFDGKVSFLEYLLYQYRDYANPKDFTHRAMKNEPEEHPEIAKARIALELVNDAIRKYEEEKQRLESSAATPGVKGLGAKHQLAIIHAGPLAENLNKSLITAEAAIRIATKKFTGPVISSENGNESFNGKRMQGAIWWLNRDLKWKQELYGRRKH